MKKQFFVWIVLSIFFLFLFPKQISAATIPYTITSGITGELGPQGRTILTVNFDVNYQNGQIIFSGNPDGTGNTVVDDAALIWVVKRPDGTSASTTFRYDNGCSYISEKPPQDITSLFKPGINQIQVKLYDVCGWYASSSSLYLVNTNAPEPPKTPLIIVPGIMASSNWGILTDKGDTGWKWFATADSSWRQFIDSLEKAGYQKDKNYFIAFYDWRKTNDWTNSDLEAASPAKKYLAETIDKAKAANPGISKVNVVAHSLGGLVTRSYVESPNYRDDINKAFLIGSPNAGSTFAYYTWEGGEVPPNWNPVQKAILNMIINYLSINFLQNRYSMIHEHIKGLKDLLPVGYNYLLKNNNFIDWTNMLEVNNFLRNTSNPQNTASIFTNRGVKLINITGTGQDTWEKLQAEDFLHQYLWKDGKPIGSAGISNGDDTVLASSSNLPGTEQITVSGKHANLPNIAASQIFNKLGITYNPSTLAGAPDEVMVAWVASPVDLTVTDNQGNNVGELLTDPYTDRKWVFIENPQGNYQLHLTGTGTGEYHVGVDYYTSTRTENVVKQGAANTGINLDYDLNFDPQNPQPLLLQPIDSIPPSTTYQLQGTPGINGWFWSDVNLSLSANDNEGGTGVNKIEYSFDNDTWQTYTQPITIDKEGITTIYYHSSDLVGNKEDAKQLQIKIDKTSPEAIFVFNPDTKEIEVQGIDNQSYINSINKENNLVTIIDKAGHSLIIKIKEEDLRPNNLSIESFSYDNQLPIKVKENEFKVEFSLDKIDNVIREMEQKIEIEDDMKITAHYSQIKNETEIKVEKNDQEEKINAAGLTLLKLTTSKGNLEANY